MHQQQSRIWAPGPYRKPRVWVWYKIVLDPMFSMFLVLDPGVMECPIIISPGIIDIVSHKTGSRQGQESTLSFF